MMNPPELRWRSSDPWTLGIPSGIWTLTTCEGRIGSPVRSLGWLGFILRPLHLSILSISLSFYAFSFCCLLPRPLPGVNHYLLHFLHYKTDSLSPIHSPSLSYSGPLLGWKRGPFTLGALGARFPSGDPFGDRDVNGNLVRSYHLVFLVRDLTYPSGLFPSRLSSLPL